jgi:uncharacterized membrane protein YphA (DoxX/SURF4 family)
MEQKYLITKQADFQHKMAILRISIGVIYLWFGMLKFFPSLSPAEQLAQETIHCLTCGLISPEVSIILLAIWETVLGVLLIGGWLSRTVIIITLIHMICTFTPFIFASKSLFTAPFAFTLTGQYIMKNIIIVSALWLIYPEKQKTEKPIFT